MSLYDDDDTVTANSASAGWSSGIKMMQNQMAFKKATVTAPKRDHVRRRVTTDKLPPVIDLKSRRDDDENLPPFVGMPKVAENVRINQRELNSDPEWKFINEYDPMWPNDYEKVVKDIREKREREEDEQRRQERDEREKRRRERDNREESGFSRTREQIEEEEDERDRPRRAPTAGAAIAPPPSLSESPPPQIIMPPQSLNPNTQRSAAFGGFGSSIAAKIMAKYGFKEGQGLGKAEQGIVKALEVEKTSKRGGRIVHENEAGAGSASPPPPVPAFNAMPPPPMPLSTTAPKQETAEKSFADILKNPSKVALLLNMVGPGEVDDDLEPEVREECSGKYGPVTKVLMYEIPNACDEEAIRIFVEFQRMESAVKAVIDLNGRFFGGRQVRAGFYEFENFKSFKLNEDFN